MKKILLLLLIFAFCTPVSAYEDDLWSNFGDINFYNTDKNTAVSDEQFDKTVEKVKEKQKKKGWFSKIGEPKKMKGESFQQSNETELLKDINKEVPILMIPCELKALDGSVIPVGHYQVECEKNSDGYVTMKFYQAHYVIAQFPAEETDEDLFDEHLNYLTLDDFDDNRVKINYGSMDFNAFAIIEKAASP